MNTWMDPVRKTRGTATKSAVRVVLAVACALLAAGAITPGVSPAATAAAPAVLGWFPGVARNVPLTGPITVYFDRMMDRASVERFWSVFPGASGTFHWNGAAVSYRPNHPFKAASYYRLTIDRGARDLHGASLGSPFSVAFSTGDALTVRSVIPAANTGSVPANTPIAINFSHPMVALQGLGGGAAAPSHFHVAISPATIGTGSWLGTSTWVFHPAGGLRPSSSYTVALGGNVQDALGQALGHGLHWTFSTVGPEIVERRPYRGAQYSDPRASINVVFNQLMDRQQTARGVTVRQGRAIVPGGTAWSGNTLIFHPSYPLQAGATYSVSVAATARSANRQRTLRRAVSWTFRAAPLPRVVSSQPGEARTNWNGAVQLGLSAPLDQATLDRHLSIVPKLGTVNTYAYDGGNGVATTYGINGDFQPSTRYTVTLGAGMHDRFGRAVPAFVLHFTMPPLQPSAQLYGAPGAAEGIEAAAGQIIQAPVQFVNVPRVHYVLVRSSLAAIAANANINSFQPPAGKRIRQWSRDVPNPLNKVENLQARLANTDNSPLSPGLYWLGAEAKGQVAGVRPGASLPWSSEIVIISNAGITTKAAGNRRLVWITSATTGKPLARVKIQLLDPGGKSRAAALTDSRGLHTFTYANATDQSIAIQVNDGRNFALAKGYYQPNTLYHDPRPIDLSPKPLSPGATYAYTDRPIYRPGQTVHFRAMLWHDHDAVYSFFGPRSVQIYAGDSQGRRLYHTNLRLDRYGAVHGSFRLPANTPTGSDNISIWLPRVQVGTSASFTVADYRKPEFLTSVTAQRPDYVTGQTAVVRVRVRYFFGAPVVRQSVNWVACSQARFPSSPRWDAYQFFDWETYWDRFNPNPPQFGPTSNQCSFGRLLARGSGRTDARGLLQVRLPLNLAHTAIDQTITVEATTTDINHQSVSGRATFAAHKASFAIGLAADLRVVAAGKSDTVHVVAVRPDGGGLPQIHLSASIYRRTYSSRLAGSSNGPRWQSIPHDVLLETRQLTTDGKGEAEVKLTARDGGQYFIKVEGQDAAGNKTSNALSVYVDGAGFSDWGNSDSTAVALTPDKQSYRVGDTAHILVAAPFADATALITLERGGIRLVRVQQLTGNSPTVDIPITLTDLPNVYVTVTLYRGWRNGSPPDWRYGTTNLHVKVDPRRLIVHLQQNHRKFHPGDAITYLVQTTDNNGRPVSGQVSLALVDSAVLALQQDSSAPILDAFYAERGSEVATASDGVLSIDHLRQQPAFSIRATGCGSCQHDASAAVPSPARFASGGGGGGRPAVVVRSQFADTAAWRANLQTDRSGKAIVHLRLPDNTTTWRLDARGVSANQQVGQATLTTLASKDIIVRPVAPRFLLEGDTLQLGAVINNNLGRPVAVSVSAKAKGIPLRFAPTGRIAVPAHGERLVNWPITVPRGRTALLVFRADSDTSGVRGDAVRLVLPIHPPLTDETVATAGQVFGSTRQLVIVPRNALPRPGSLSVRISAALTAGMGSALAGLGPYPFESNESIADRVLAAASLRRLPASITGLSSGQYAGLPVVIRAGAVALIGNQLSDGGWPWFNDPYESSDTAITTDVVQAIKSAGLSDIGGHALSAGQSYLRRNIWNGYPRALMPAERVRLLAVLAGSGAADQHDVQAIYGNTVGRAHLSTGSLAELQLALQLGGDRARSLSLASVLDGRAQVSATGAHWENGAGDGWYGSVVATTAEALTALLATAPRDPFVPAAARWLMLARQGAGWDCAHDTAQVLAALSAYARAAGEGRADYHYRVALNSRVKLTGHYAGTFQRQVGTVSVPVGSVRRSSPLDIQRQGTGGTFGSGSLYYVARLHYYVRANAVAARSAGITVSRRYYDLGRHPIGSISAGSLLRVQLSIHTDQLLTYLDIEDPIPAGLEPVDQSLLTSGQATLTTPQAVDPSQPVDLSWLLTHTDLRDDRVSLYAGWLPAGTYSYTYLAQATVPGTYATAPTHAQETFFPEVFGRGVGQTFTVR